MSGGHWDYSHFRIEDYLKEVANDGSVIRRFPRVSSVFRELAKTLGQGIHDLDYDLSGDSFIDKETEWETELLNKLQVALQADPTVGLGLPVWYACDTYHGVLGPFANQCSAWKAVALPNPDKYSMHFEGAYVWPENKNDDRE